MLLRILLAAALVLGLPLRAQDYPVKPIKIIVPFAPGATTDILARIIGEKLWVKWGQPVIVENRAGAGGNIGAEVAYKADPDGHTLLCSPPSTLVINKNVYARLAYDPDAFVPVTVIALVPTALIVHPKVRANSVQQLIALAKSRPGQINYASQGVGGTGHLTGEMFKATAGIGIVHVPYKGAAPAITDLVAGQVDMMFETLGSTLTHIRANHVRALAVTSEKRSAYLPDVPAMSEILPGFVSVTWFGMVATPRTPLPVANKLSAAIAETLKLPDIAKRLAELSADPVGNTPAEMARFLKQETERWAGVIRFAAVKAE